MLSIKREILLRFTVYFFLSFLLCSSCGGCLDWLKNLCCKEEPQSITSNNSISNNDDKINEKKISQNLFIIGDVKKCKKVMELINADNSYLEGEVMIYNKEILDDEGYHNTFKFYLCGNNVVKCEKIYYKNNDYQSSYFFFFVDITDSESLNKLGNLLTDFKQNFQNETSRLFLILLETNSQVKRKIDADEAENFCKDKEFKFFGEIDSQNMTWDFKDKQEYFDVIEELESEAGYESDYKFGKMNSGTMSYDVQGGKDIWGMFLCGVKYSEIKDKIYSKEFKYQNIL